MAAVGKGENDESEPLRGENSLKQGECSGPGKGSNSEDRRLAAAAIDTANCLRAFSICEWRREEIPEMGKHHRIATDQVRRAARLFGLELDRIVARRVTWSFTRMRDGPCRE